MKDKLFLLSEDEYKKYVSSKDIAACNYRGDTYNWWLRTPGCASHLRVGFVKTGGTFLPSGCCERSSADFKYCAVRPALYLKSSFLHALPRDEHNDAILFASWKWIILDEDTGLLLSKDAICLREFDQKSNDYNDSGVRKYLNGFAEKYFSEIEKDMIKDFCVSEKDSDSVSTEIQKLAYELYKVDWLNCIPEKTKKNTLKSYYKDFSPEEKADYSFEDYLFDYGYGGQFYVCFEEFLGAEYNDKGYIQTLLQDDELFKEYLKDVIN